MKRLGVITVLSMLMISSKGWCNQHYEGWLGGALLGGLVVGTIIESLPEHHKVVVINGQQYYYDGSHYYEESPGGYVVIEEPPTVVVAPEANIVSPTITHAAGVTVAISTSNGGTRDILLVKKGHGYVGPNGEYYDSLPTTGQLQAIYGNEPSTDDAE